MPRETFYSCAMSKVTPVLGVCYTGTTPVVALLPKSPEVLGTSRKYTDRAQQAVTIHCPSIAPHRVYRAVRLHERSGCRSLWER